MTNQGNKFVTVPDKIEQTRKICIPTGKHINFKGTYFPFYN